MSEIAAGAMSVQQPERAATRARSDIQELAERIAGVGRRMGVPRRWTVCSSSGILVRRNRSTAWSRSSFCIIAHGSKAVFSATPSIATTPNYLLAPAELPIVGQIIEATRERPYLAMSMALDLNWWPQ